MNEVQLVIQIILTSSQQVCNQRSICRLSHFYPPDHSSLWQ